MFSIILLHYCSTGKVYGSYFTSLAAQTNSLTYFVPSTRAQKHKSLNLGYYLSSLAYPMAQSKGVYLHLYFSAFSFP